ncbi:dNTP triphosphohydrolase [Candidatus Peregrinibacteria bacterium]|nr:dNTP triphosphohydrolase [Candidatus Peregrinibacteria bacterium]
MKIIRKILEENELAILADYAVKSNKSAGRKFKEIEDKERMCFQKDKDRIIHSKAFRRLDEKTQVFIAGSGDHYRTRLTHTIEVAQVSRDLARRLRLNEDLSEAIALAHDLGHPPFGHGGETVLNEMMRKFGLDDEFARSSRSHRLSGNPPLAGRFFEHNQQSRRVVESLEKLYPSFDGLNLTLEVLDGLIKHQTPWDQNKKKFETSPHLDMDDGLRCGLINLDRLGRFEIWKLAMKKVLLKYGKILNNEVLISRVISAVISIMISDLCTQTMKNIKKFKIKSVENVKNHKGIIADFSPKMKSMIKELRQYLFKNFYMHPKISHRVDEGKKMIKKLFEFYVKNPKKLPRKNFLRGKDSLAVAIKDYIAGMTDGFLSEEFVYLVRPARLENLKNI